MLHYTDWHQLVLQQNRSKILGVLFSFENWKYEEYSNKKIEVSRVAVAEWLARLPAKQEVCGSNPASYLCWNTHVGKANGLYTLVEVSH